MVATALFYIFAAIATAGAIMVVAQRNPVYSALYLVLTLFALAGEYVLLMAHFIAIVHVAVYAGAIVVLFLFVIMLLNVRLEERAPDAFRYMIYAGLPMAAILFVEMGYFAFRGFQQAMVQGTRVGLVESIGRALFSQYVLPFEVASILLLVAMIGALYLSKRKLEIVAFKRPRSKKERLKVMMYEEEH
ncbi:MAG: NADH-quinone oxidoreductase subunit J [Calditrichaeota bacterium]|nr:MAG: NADH-quinone oxidoreductase subunit J [Calditrichota bacterium]